MDMQLFQNDCRRLQSGARPLLRELPLMRVSELGANAPLSGRKGFFWTLEPGAATRGLVFPRAGLVRPIGAIFWLSAREVGGRGRAEREWPIADRR